MNTTSPLNSHNLVSFEKRLRANCSIIEDGLRTPSCIYELEDGDEDYFEKMIFQKDWQNSRYILRADEAINSAKKDYGVFVLENAKNKCLGFCVVSNKKGIQNLEYIETIPKQKAKNKKRKISYIGETLIAFLMKNSNEGENFYIKSTLGDAIPFYEKYKFKYQDDKDYDFVINDNEKNDMIITNENHTGKMEYIA